LFILNYKPYRHHPILIEPKKRRKETTITTTTSCKTGCHEILCFYYYEGHVGSPKVHMTPCCTHILVARRQIFIARTDRSNKLLPNAKPQTLVFQILIVDGGQQLQLMIGICEMVSP